MRSSRVIRASDCQCQSSNFLGFDEAVLNIVVNTNLKNLNNKSKRICPFNTNTFANCLLRAICELYLNPKS
jgi:hypothetical protein